MPTDCNYGKPLESRDLENRAKNFENDFEKAYSNNSYKAGLIETKHVAQKFIEETMKELDHDDQYKVLSRAQELNDKAYCSGVPYNLPLINIVFGDADKHGKRDDLLSVKTIGRTSISNEAISIVQEIYHR